MKKRFAVKPVVASTKRQNIMAADEDDDMMDFDDNFDDAEFDDDMDYASDDAIQDTVDDAVDAIEDLQDAVDEIEDDDINIDQNNNIENHYIAECEHCHGVFISATIKSDIVVSSVTGVCPLCDKEGEQLLKWLIIPAKDAE